jgi:hypothetical protein
MKSPVVTAAVACGIAAIVLGTSATRQQDHEHAGLLRNEVVRLRAHFDSVLGELSSRDVSNLRSPQQAARAELIRALAGYRDADRFPHNHDFPGERVPYFRDDHGTLCAMAYLVAATGRQDLVDAVAKGRNNAYIPELAADARLSAWLDSVGLTVAEAARIQPTYDGRPPIVVEDRHPARYVLPSLTLGLPALITAVVNWRAPREKRADGALFVGALSGAATAILGGAILADEQHVQLWRLGMADVAAGSAALVAVVRRSIRHSRAGPSRPPIAAAVSRFTIGVVPSRHGDQVLPAARVQVRF